jgi:pimeloyl-ACP methyl ester carboxylesterase
VSAQPLLLLPGLLCDAAVWEPQVAALGDQADCIVADYGNASSITEMAQIALSRAPVGPLAVAGHSMGGRVALEVIRLAPDRVTRLALMDTGYQALVPGFVGEGEKKGRYALLETARADGMRALGLKWAPGMVHPSRVNGPVFEAVLQMIERKTPEIFAAQINALINRPDASGQLPGITVPTLVLCGRDDSWSPLSRHQEMHAVLPRSTLSVIENSGHMSTMEEPEQVTAAMKAWLSAPG